MVFYEFSYSILKFVYFQNVIFLVFFHTNFQLTFFTVYNQWKIFKLKYLKYTKIYLFQIFIINTREPMLQNDINAILRTSAEICQKMIILTSVKTIQFERFFPLFPKNWNFSWKFQLNTFPKQFWKRYILVHLRYLSLKIFHWL
jgi:hypothetical protein